MTRARTAQTLVAVGCCLWAAPLAFIAGVLSPGFRRAAGDPLLDRALVVMALAFALGSPVLAITGWVLSERGTRTRRLAVAQTLVWLVAILGGLAATTG